MSFLTEEKLTEVDTAGRLPMTVNGVVVRSAFLLFLSVAAGVAGWMFLPGNWFLPAVLVGIVGTVVFAIWANKNPVNAKLPAMGYAVMQGFLVGAISRGYAETYDGIIQQAMLITAALVIGSLFLFATGIVKVTAKFRSMVLIGVVGVGLYYLLAVGLALFGIQAPLIWDSGPIGIGFSLFVIAIAVGDLFVVYDTILKSMEHGADERVEWFAGFGLVSTVLWIYIEILRLLSKVRS